MLSGYDLVSKKSTMSEFPGCDSLYIALAANAVS
jgi:hypothetical protein